jgi:hypothetical protein
MPYISMASEIAKDTTASCTVMADYYPYDFPYPRLRILLNDHIVLFFVEWGTFLGTLVLVQFSANILHPIYDYDTGVFLGWLPNRTIVFIVIACHILLLLNTLFLMAWLNDKTTGLLPAAQPGSLTTTIGMLYGGIVSGNGVHEDFLGLDGEDRRWVIRKRLEGNTYRLGYWEKDGQQYYGIGRGDPSKEEQDQARAFKRSACSPRPKFSYIPWFLRPLSISIAVSILTAFLAVAVTIIRGTDALQYGFSSSWIYVRFADPLNVASWVPLEFHSILCCRFLSTPLQQYRRFLQGHATVRGSHEPSIVINTDGPRAGAKLPVDIACCSHLHGAPASSLESGVLLICFACCIIHSNSRCEYVLP